MAFSGVTKVRFTAAPVGYFGVSRAGKTHTGGMVEMTCCALVREALGQCMPPNWQSPMHYSLATAFCPLTHIWAWSMPDGVGSRPLCHCPPALASTLPSPCISSPNAICLGCCRDSGTMTYLPGDTSLLGDEWVGVSKDIGVRTSRGGGQPLLNAKAQSCKSGQIRAWHYFLSCFA